MGHLAPVVNGNAVFRLSGSIGSIDFDVVGTLLQVDFRPQLLAGCVEREVTVLPAVEGHRHISLARQSKDIGFNGGCRLLRFHQVAVGAGDVNGGQRFAFALINHYGIFICVAVRIAGADVNAVFAFAQGDVAVQFPATGIKAETLAGIAVKFKRDVIFVRHFLYAGADGERRVGSAGVARRRIEDGDGRRTACWRRGRRTDAFFVINYHFLAGSSHTIGGRNDHVVATRPQRKIGGKALIAVIEPGVAAIDHAGHVGSAIDVADVGAHDAIVGVIGGVGVGNGGCNFDHRR